VSVRAPLLRLCALLAVAACDDGPEVVELHGVRVTVPAGWSSSTVYDGPKYILTMNPPRRDAACQVVVIKDGRNFRDDDAQALLGEGRATAGGRPAGDVRLDASIATLRGFAADGPRAQASWNVLPPQGASRVEMYAAARDVRLVAAVVATWAASPDAAAHRQSCIGSVRSMR